MPANEKQDKGGSRKSEVGRIPGKAIDAYFGRLHY